MRFACPTSLRGRRLPSSVGREALFAVALSAQLEGMGCFRVIVGCGDHDAVVRFHRVRPREEWLSDDLESYVDEAILVIDVESAMT